MPCLRDGESVLRRRRRFDIHTKYVKTAFQHWIYSCYTAVAPKDLHRTQPRPQDGPAHRHCNGTPTQDQPDNSPHRKKPSSVESDASLLHREMSFEGKVRVKARLLIHHDARARRQAWPCYLGCQMGRNHIKVQSASCVALGLVDEPERVEGV